MTAGKNTFDSFLFTKFLKIIDVKSWLATVLFILFFLQNFRQQLIKKIKTTGNYIFGSFIFTKLLKVTDLKLITTAGWPLYFGYFPLTKFYEVN